MMGNIERIGYAHLDEWQINYFKKEIKELKKYSKQELIYKCLSLSEDIDSFYDEQAGASL